MGKDGMQVRVDLCKAVIADFDRFGPSGTGASTDLLVDDASNNHNLDELKGRMTTKLQD